MESFQQPVLYTRMHTKETTIELHPGQESNKVIEARGICPKLRSIHIPDQKPKRKSDYLIVVELCARPSGGLSMFGVAMALSLAASRFEKLTSRLRSSPPSVVRLCPVFFITGIVRGLNTRGLTSGSLSPLPIRLTCDAVNMVVSPGELPFDDEGLR